jgi:hypothetical protein
MINPAPESPAQPVRSGPKAAWARPFGTNARRKATRLDRLRMGLEKVPHRLACERNAAMRIRRDACT